MNAKNTERQRIRKQGKARRRAKRKSQGGIAEIKGVNEMTRGGRGQSLCAAAELKTGVRDEGGNRRRSGARRAAPPPEMKAKGKKRLRRPDSNRRPQDYEPCELAAAPLRCQAL